MKTITTKTEVSDWLDSMNIKNYTIHDDLTVDVVGSVDLSKKNLTTLPIQFGMVSNTFDISNNQLTSLKGSPNQCFMFICRNNLLTNLEYSPQKVSQKFDCSHNQLVSLKGSPENLFGFFCNSNHLTNLEGMPKTIEGFFICSDNPIQINSHLEINCSNFSHTTHNENEKISLFNDLYKKERNLFVTNLSQKVLNERLLILKEKNLINSQLNKTLDAQYNNRKLKL